MSVYRPKDKAGKFRAPFYLYDFTVGGRRFHGSTGATTRQEAERVEDAKRLQAKRTLNDTTIAGAFGRFWAEVGQHEGAATTTFQRMERLQDGLQEILREGNLFDAMGSISENELARYVARRRLDLTPQGKAIAPATVNREIQVLRRIMRRAVIVWKHAITLPDWKTVLLDEPEEHVVNIGRELEQKIIERMRPDFRPAMRFLVMSGLRAGSVLTSPKGKGRGPLRPEQVDFDTGMIVVSAKSKRPGGRVVRIPITRAMKILLANELGHHPEAVFTYEAARTEDGRIRGQRYPIAYGTFYHEFKIAAKEAGRPDLRPHDLRHTAATRTLMETGNMRLAQQQLGHTRLSTTERYTHPLVEDLRAALEAVHISEPVTEQKSENSSNHLKSRRKSRRLNRS